MKFKVMLIIQAIVGILFGISFIFMPALAMDSYLFSKPSESYILLTRMYGTFPLALAVLCLLFLRVTDITAKKAVAMSMPVWQVIHSILFVIGISQEILTPVSWATFVVPTLLAIGFISSALRKDP